MTLSARVFQLLLLLSSLQRQNHVRGFTPISTYKTSITSPPLVPMKKPNIVPGSSARNSLFTKQQQPQIHAASSSLSTDNNINSRSHTRTTAIKKSLANLLQKLYPILYPGSRPDPTIASPLPEGKMGCPFFGANIFRGDYRDGPGTFFRKLSRELNDPALYRYYAFGKPMIGVAGSTCVKNVLEREFRTGGGGVRSVASLNPYTFGKESLLSSQTREEHLFLRKLVGQSMTPRAIEAGIPLLEEGARGQIEGLMEGRRGVAMEKVCTDYTLDVAWRQILGLRLEEGQIPEFRRRVHEWIFGLINPFYLLFPKLSRFSKCYRARRYLMSLIEDKIDDLENNGPDGSTLSTMVFAKDEDDATRRLSREQIIDNALLLILAGSETSASTLTNAFLFLGLFPDVLQKAVEEQRRAIEKSAAQLSDGGISKAQLSNDFPYLEAIIKETMRIRPLSGGIGRTVKETFVLDGKQVPKDWTVSYNIRLTHERDPVTRTENNGHMSVKTGFRPERWLSEETCPSSDWLAFGFGPRFCLGANLAMAEMKIFLALFVRNVAFDLVNYAAGDEMDVKWRKMSIIPKPKDGVVVNTRKAII